MKASVIGMGSIGKRHYENLRILGVNVHGFDINDIPDYNVDFAVISTHEHVSFIQECLSRGIPFFVEKPVVDNLNDLNTLKYVSNHYGVLNMVACNLRFSETLHDISVEDIISIHARVSDSNPNRSKYDHPIWLQDIHEFDLMSHLISPIEHITMVGNEDSYDALISHENGIVSTVHGDKLSAEYHRSLTVETESGTRVLHLNVSNQMYLKQMEYFVYCLKNNVQPMNNLEDALDVTEKLLNRDHYPSKTYIKSVS